MSEQDLFLQHGTLRLRVDRAGLLLGRSPVCDVILTDPRASRSQALVRIGSGGPEILHLGRHPTLLNGEEIGAHAPLTPGDAVDVAGARFTVVARGTPHPKRAWALQVDGGLLVGASRRQLTVGGGGDDVVLSDLPARAAVFHRVGDALLVELSVDGALDGELIEAGAVESLQVDQALRLGAHTVVVQSDLNAPATVGTEADGSVLTAAVLEFLPLGGRLSLTFGAVTTAVELSEMRCRLLAVLLDPPGGYRAGDNVPDEIVLTAVWPRDATKSRTDLNQLVHRLRRALLVAEIDPHAVLSRPRAGGSVGFRLHPDTTVRVS